MQLPNPMAIKYVVFENESVYIPGDERSRTHPGHGYPAETREYTKPVFFKNDDELFAYLDKQSTQNRPQRVFTISEVEIKRTVNYEVKPNGR